MSIEAEEAWARVDDWLNENGWNYLGSGDRWQLVEGEPAVSRREAIRITREEIGSGPPGPPQSPIHEWAAAMKADALRRVERSDRLIVALKRVIASCDEVLEAIDEIPKPEGTT